MANLQSTVDDLLSRLPQSERDAAVPLLDAAPLVERLVGHRPHRSALHRWAARGTAGVLLQVLRVGSTRFVTPRLLAQFFAEAGAARPAAPPRRKAATRRVPARRAARTTTTAAAATHTGGSDDQA